MQPTISRSNTNTSGVGADPPVSTALLPPEQGTGVRAVTLWPGAVNTESTSFPGAESVEFSGRAVAALLEAQASPTQQP